MESSSSNTATTGGSLFSQKPDPEVNNSLNQITALSLSSDDTQEIE
ncbi:hypothetical protein DFAR_2560002 [Desulfarculales bacterium]